jgi:hypothetical protein
MIKGTVDVIHTSLNNNREEYKTSLLSILNLDWIALGANRCGIG